MDWPQRAGAAYEQEKESGRSQNGGSRLAGPAHSGSVLLTPLLLIAIAMVVVVVIVIAALIETVIGSVRSLSH